jgi:hypothetical protein
MMVTPSIYVVFFFLFPLLEVLGMDPGPNTFWASALPLSRTRSARVQF